MRFILAIIIGGGFLSFTGYQEYLVSSNAKSTPSKVKVEDLEKGVKLKNNYVQLEEHIALIGGCVYSAKLRKGQSTIQKNSTVEYCYYPLISYEHPYLKEQDRLIEKYGKYEMIPKNELPKLRDIKVLVKSTKYSTVSSIPEEVDHKNKFRGLVINSIDSVKSEEAALLSQSFPGINVNKVIIIEQDRKPSSMMISLLMMAGGALIIVGGGAYGLKSFRA
ncbi:MAG: hypothetical protein NE328_02025 [Lentisphaeraceae bacterium]|nr:hypothetical protein [Lentisphaeraceae bacterium]